MTTDAEDHAPAELTGAELVVRTLVDLGVEVVFGYPGGAVLPIYDAIFKQNELRHILVRHEQGAVHAAEGYARSTGKVGTVLVTSGPGATNSVTGLTDALMDSIPVVCLTGQVPTHMIGNDAFQEADTIGITRPCTKHNYLIKDVDNLCQVIREAYYIASAGRPGPVVVDLPKDVVMAKAPYAPDCAAPGNGLEHRSYRPQRAPDADAVKRTVELLARAKRPLFYAGGGVINAGPDAAQSLAALVQRTGYPITNTLMGLGCYPGSDPLFLGMLGMHGTYEANMAMAECDLMIAVGARFDDRVTGRLADFSRGSTKVQIDIDPSSINKNVPGGCRHRRRCGPRARRPPGRMGGERRETQHRSRGVVAAARQVARARLPALQELQQHHQAAIRAAAALRGHQGAGRLLHHRGGPAPDVGRAVPQVRGAQPLDDLGRPRHHGLRLPGRDGRAGGPSRTRSSSTSPARRRCS